MAKNDRTSNNSLSPDDYVKGILGGDITVLSKAITIVESTLETDLEISQKIIEKCLPHSGNSVRIGITGVPGVGKSTFIDTFGSYLTNEKGKRVAASVVESKSLVEAILLTMKVDQPGNLSDPQFASEPADEDQGD